MSSVVSVSGAGSLFGQGIIRCLHQAGLDIQIHGLDYFDTAIGFAWCAHRTILPDILSPDVSEDAWFDRLCEALLAVKSQYLFVGVDFDLLPLSRRAAELKARTGCVVIVSPEDLVLACRDKLATPELLRRHGFPAPLTLASSAGVDEIERQIGFPLILKPRYGTRSRGVRIIRHRADLEAGLREDHSLIAQQYLPGDDSEFSCGVIYLNGQVDAVSVLRRQLKDGNTAIAYSESHPDIEAFCAAVAMSLKPFGPMNLQLRLADQVPMIFEINPRFSGTTIFRCRLGVNEPKRILRHLMGLPSEGVAKLRPGRVIRYFEELVEFSDG